MIACARQAGVSPGLPSAPNPSRRSSRKPCTAGPQASRQHGGMARPMQRGAGSAPGAAASAARRAAPGSTSSACAAPAARPRPRHATRALLHLALLSVACLGGALVGGHARSRGSSVAPAAAVPPSGTAAPPGSIHLAVVAPLQQASPFGSFGRQASWREVLEHTAQRLAWEDPAFSLTLHDSALLSGGSSSDAERSALQAALQHSSAAVAIGVTDPTDAQALAPLLAAAPTALAVGSHAALSSATRLGGHQPMQPAAGGLAALLQKLFPDKQATEDQQVLHTVEELFKRGTSDDFLFIFLVLANSYVKEVPAVAMSFKQKNAGLSELQCMVGKCGAQIFGCVTDTSCKAALDCLSACEFNDQVCSYRCITSYESKKLEEFSLCIIQKHNCFGLSADIPMVPDPAPLTSFKSQPMTHELAEDLFIGWLQDPSTALAPLRGGQQLPYSWRVFAGKNAAYDFFPCQNQLFYRGKGKGGMWYDPVFQVKTIDGRTVWRRRHYRVKRDRVPGTFRFSVLDNGVTSSEFWRILDCDEGLDWCVFYYSGAASRAGLSYSGAILASKSGDWPASQEALARIQRALDTAGIKMWELSNVDNSGCVGAPLDPALMAMA